MSLKFVNRIGQRLRGFFTYEIPDSVFIWMQILVSLLFCLLPLFKNLSYGQNFFVMWEGAYRLSQGQVPYRDFGIPMGIGFWLAPALFFKLFGPFVINLLKAQILLNLISLGSLRVIFKKLGFNEATIFIILLVNCISFVFINNWPWYNHTVYVFQLLSIMFLVLYFAGKKRKFRYINLVVCALFSVLAFFTKQDGGAFSILINGILLTLFIVFYQPRKFYDIGVFAFLIIFLLAGYIFLFKNYDFGYWFNYGQYPHYSRVNMWDILDKFFGESMFIKFYLAFGIAASLFTFYWVPNVKFDQLAFLVVAICLLILSQVIVIQVTSFSPATGILYYHTFGIALMLFLLKIPFKRTGLFLIGFLSIMLIFSDCYWPTAQKKIRSLFPSSIVNKNHDVVSLNTWASAATDSIMPVKNVYSSLKTLEGLRIPEYMETGIDSIFKLQVFKEKQSDLRVLNMSNLTFLAYEMDYQLLTGPCVPLWYHKGVCLFDREIDFLCELIKNNHFDIIIFENMEGVQDYFPYPVRDCIIEHYVKVFDFGGKNNSVEVYELTK